ncbi:MAG: transglutaminase-like cysteine peptidase [Desulfovibrio sp.]|nr:transglutaminase-like cysteine peptidase [Desulfovibrio sp.]
MKALLLCLCALLCARAAAADDGWRVVLGKARQEEPAADAAAWLEYARLWRQVLRAYARDAEQEKDSLAWLPQVSLESRLNLEKALPRMKPLEKVSAISGFINFQAEGATDKEIYGVEEKWAAPGEFFRRARGDCEDFAIAKYFVLREKGFSPDELRLLIVREGGTAGHMLLAVLIGGQPHIIDNNSRPPGLVLRQNGHLSRYYSLRFAFNENGVWLYR